MINPFGRSKFQGQLKMTPSMNPWFDDNVKPTVVNEVGENDMFEVGVVNYLNCSFNLERHTGGVNIHVKIDSSLSRPDSFSHSQIEFLLLYQFSSTKNSTIM